MPNTKKPDSKTKETTKPMTTNEALPARRAREPEIVQTSEYPLLESSENMRQIMQLIEDNLGAQQFNVLSLPRVKVSRDGIFQIETASGMETAHKLEGVLTAYRQARIYWGRVYNAQTAKVPPSCTSTDGFTGVGDPGGSCAQCPYSKFKSAKNPDGSQGAGQACKELRQLLILLPGQTLPHRLDVPPTSIQHFNKYSLNLVYASAPYWGVITKLALEQGPTASGMPITRVNFTLARKLDSEQRALLEPYHQRMAGFLKPMAVETDAYEEEPAGGADDKIPF